MRIVGGTMRGTALADLGRGDAAAHLRPTADRVRESLFNILVQGRYGNLVAGARVLDVFAGTGALGLEALSRGAASVTFLENGKVALGLLDRNIRLCRAGDTARVVTRDATRPGPGQPHDLIFLDPPYGQGLGERAVEALRGDGWLAPGATLVWEESAPPLVPAWMRLMDQRRYGQTTITLAELSGAELPGAEPPDP